MSEQSNQPTDPTAPPPPSDPTAPASPVPAPAPVPAPPPSSALPAPDWGRQPGAAPAAYGSGPGENPYGGYTQAPPSAAYPPGQAPAGSLPYVESHFGPVATFGPRALAYIVDGLVSAIGIVPMLIGVGLIVGGAASSTTIDPYTNTLEHTGGGGGLIAIGTVLVVVGGLLGFAIWLWNRVFRMGRTGQSIGKKMVGLKLVNAATGQPIGAGTSFLRELAHGIINQVVYLSFLWMLWDQNRQTLADLIVKSTVITVPKE